MTLDIALFLAQDGIVNASIYALIALALVLVFLVTRILFVPQGEFVSFSALTLATFSLGHVPATIWVLLGGAIASAGMTVWRDHARTGRLPMPRGQILLVACVLTVGWALLSALDFFADRYLARLSADTVGAGADLAVRKQVTQVRVFEPGSLPEPAHTSQRSGLVTEICFSQPSAASSKEISRS